ncbi:MAG: BLUF domain-containing protein [Parvibaculum sp.]
MVYQLAYFSAAAPGLADADVHAILRKSTENNRRAGISGMLLLVDGTFFQVLEGDKESVEETFARISRDPRHSGVIRVVGEERDERSFPRWSMGFEKIRYGAAEGPILPFDAGDLSDSPRLDALRKKSPEILSFMRSLYSSRNMRGAPALERPA